MPPRTTSVASRLRYAHDDGPGIARVIAGKGFRYLRKDGRPVRDPATLRRIAALAIPPAWTRVWISTDPRGHVQATGRDARGRKQYRYHADWTRIRNDAKYDHLVAFARVLPRIRRSVVRDLGAAPLTRSRVLATVVALLEQTHIRVGNEEYARENGSYGLTTLLDRHVRVRGDHVEFRFRGKSRVHHAIDIQDATLARNVRRCQELPGQTLFEYRDEAGRLRHLGSTDVNGYLAELTDGDVTAKDFRTWWGTVSAAIRLRAAGPAETPAETRKTILSTIDEVADELGNTRAVCRKCYVHPHVLQAYENGEVVPAAAHRRRSLPTALTPDERAVVALLSRMRRTRPRQRPTQ